MTRITKYEKADFNGLSMLAEVMSKERVKPVFCYIFKDGSNFVASDSRRLAVYTTESDELKNLPDGFYEVVSKSSKEVVIESAGNDIGQFPDYRKVILAKFADSRSFEKFSCKYADVAGIKTGVILYRCHVALNVNYVTPILKYFSDGFTLKWSDHLSPVVFEGKEQGIIYVVAPIQLKADED